MFYNAILETVKEPIFLLIDKAHFDVDQSIIGKIIFDSNKSTINKLLDTLEKTQMDFHVEPFTSSAKRTTKHNKYY